LARFPSRAVRFALSHRRPVSKALAAFLVVGAIIASQSDGGFAAPVPPQPLKFFKNYFVTGDYVVGGVGLWGRGVKGIASGSIAISGVPADAEILSAFLYWQVVTSDGPESGAQGATFNGQLLSVPGPPAIPTRAGTIAAIADTLGTSPCWSEGGGAGASGGVKKTYTFRADVKRFLPIGRDGRHQVNRSHTIQLPDTGNANKTPKAVGASLLVIYRDPSASANLNAIVIYDGSYTLNNATKGMSQVIKGFYDPANAKGKITHIVGGAQANKTEQLLAPGVNEVNPFRGLQGQAWDNVTRETSAITADSFTTSVNPPGNGSHDCLVWSAIVYRTQVKDYDGDGLLDKWESSLSTLYDPVGNALPNLAAMGAHADRKDIFVEIGYMATSATTYGGVGKPAHTHAPTEAAVEKIGKMFLDAPVINPNGSRGIDLHLDLGPNYPRTAATSPYLVPVTEARGGEAFNEADTVCTRPANAPPWICQFSQYPGTVGWKSGFRFLRDHPVPFTMTDAACRAADTDTDPLTRCERVFDRERKDMFRYVLFVHALGLPKEDCLIDDRANPSFGFPDTACQMTNSLFHVPVTNTGVADFPGGDAIVALGGFDDGAGRPVGTDYMQAATLAHELGHTFQLRHGGAPTEPNCKPNYLSVMNYLFQLRGLRKNTGGSILDFSGQRFGGLPEGSLIEPGGLGADLDNGTFPAYRTGWYAPAGPGVVGTLASKHCDGTPLNTGETQLIRVDSATVEDTFGQIDWTKSATTRVASGGQDLNFNGSIDSLRAGYNDWQNIRLNQIGSRRNVGAWFWVKDPAPLDYGAFMGPLSLDTGLADMGLADMGLADMGSGDLTLGDLGRGDLNRGDLGRAGLGLADMGLADMGLADMGLADMGGGDLGFGDSGLGDSADGELTTDLVEAHGFAPPNDLTALVRGLLDNCAGLTPANCHRIQLDWKPTNLGSESAYQVHRVSGTSITTIGAGTLVNTVLKVSGQSAYTFIDPTELPNGVFTYVVAAVFGSSISPTDVQVTAVNYAPIPADDPTAPPTYAAVSGVLLTVPTLTGVLANDTDIDSPTLTVAPVPGTVLAANGGFATPNGRAKLNADGSFTYTSRPGYTGPDTFSYVVKDADTNRLTPTPQAVVRITVSAAP